MTIIPFSNTRPADNAKRTHQIKRLGHGAFGKYYRENPVQSTRTVIQSTWQCNVLLVVGVAVCSVIHQSFLQYSEGRRRLFRRIPCRDILKSSTYCHAPLPAGLACLDLGDPSWGVQCRTMHYSSRTSVRACHNNLALVTPPLNQRERQSRNATASDDPTKLFMSKRKTCAFH
jgi:hypothetical protein